MTSLHSTDRELDEAAEVRSEDIERAGIFWRLFGGAFLASLFDAEPFSGPRLSLVLIAGFLAAGNRFAYLVNQGVYYDLDRRQIIATRALRLYLDRALDKAAIEARNTTLQLRQARDLAAWELGMRERIKSSTIGSTFFANGGRRHTHVDALARMQETVREQYEYLRRYSLQIEKGQQPIDGQAANRSSLYIQNARAVYMAERARVAVSIGYDERLNVRFQGDSCDDCVAMERLGWTGLDDSAYIPIGERQCLHNCRCDEIYRNSRTGTRSDRQDRVAA